MTRTGPRSSGGPSVVVGLTGGIASGKSTVAKLLEARGAVVVDADVLAREVVAKGEPLLDLVAQRFGSAVLTPDGSLDRAALGRIVFADERARKDLEAMIHPAVRRRAEQLEAEASDGSVVVHVIPLLVETGQSDRFDLVVVVDADEATQLTRMRARDALDEPQARARIAAQATREDRLAVADVVVDNSGTPEHLEAQVDALWRRLTRAGRPDRGDRPSAKTVGGTT
ncbi:MAG TPA: dephospho-CoA kinase [Propionibacteriaceae bacterium]|nr:dephospho-CoA kinase [Propionibacteriaceae bacterium]